MKKFIIMSIVGMSVLPFTNIKSSVSQGTSEPVEFLPKASKEECEGLNSCSYYENGILVIVLPAMGSF